MLSLSLTSSHSPALASSPRRECSFSLSSISAIVYAARSLLTQRGTRGVSRQSRGIWTGAVVSGRGTECRVCLVCGWGLVWLGFGVLVLMDVVWCGVWKECGRGIYLVWMGEVVGRDTRSVGAPWWATRERNLEGELVREQVYGTARTTWKKWVEDTGGL